MHCILLKKWLGSYTTFVNPLRDDFLPFIAIHFFIIFWNWYTPDIISGSMTITTMQLIIAAPIEPIAVEDGLLSGALVCFRKLDVRSSLAINKAFFLIIIVSCTVKLFSRQMQTHCTVPFVIWTVSVALLMLESVGFCNGRDADE